MAYQIPQGYELIPIAPTVAQVVPTQGSYPAVQSPSHGSPSSKEGRSPVPALIAVGALGLAVLLLTQQSSGLSKRELESQNYQLQQQNADLRNRVDQLEYQLLGIYSAP